MDEDEKVEMPTVRLPDPIQLGNEDHRIPNKARLALRQMFGKIPGVSLKDVRIVTNGNDITAVKVKFEGWSPSLHRLDHDLAIPVIADLSDESFPIDIVDALEGVLKRQTMRHQLGMEYGLSAPLPAEEGRPLEMRHLTVETALITFSLLAGEEIDELGNDIRLMHLNPTKDDGDALLNGSSYAIHCGLGHLVGTTYFYKTKGGVSLSYDGLALRVHQQTIPETKIETLRGKPLSDFINIHPELDRRIIQDINVEERSISVRLVPEVIPCAWIPRIVAEHKDHDA